MKVRIGNYKSERSKKPRIEKVSVHPWDTYSADNTLAMVIYPVLVAYKKDVQDKGVVPADFLDTVDVTGISDEDAQALHEKLFNEALLKWEGLLDEMIWSFDEVRGDYAGEEAFFKIKDENADLGDLGNRYDIDNNGLNDYYEKIDMGLQLFARYYRSLWW